MSLVRHGLKGISALNRQKCLLPFITQKRFAAQAFNEDDSEFSIEEIAKFKKLFIRFDRDENCKLDKWEFNNFCRWVIGRSYNAIDLNKVICRVDLDKDEYISWEELMLHLGKRFLEQSKKRIIIAFNSFDKDGDGRLNYWEAKQALLYLGEDPAANDIRYKYDLCDTDQDEKITFKEFVRFICEFLKNRS